MAPPSYKAENPSLRVAFFSHSGALCGANRSLLRLLDGLQSHPVAPHVVTPEEGPLAEALRGRGVPVLVMGIQWWMSHSPSRYQARRRWRLNLQCLPTLIQRLRIWKIDLLYTNTSVLPVGIMAARRMNRPHVWHIHEFGALDQGLVPDRGARTFWSELRQAERFIAVSESLRAYLLRHRVRRVQCVYNGVASEAEFDERYAQARSERRGSHPFLFALVGRLDPRKGQETALRAMALVTRRFPHVRLLIVGGGEDPRFLARCQRLAGRLRIAQRVLFWGEISDPRPVYWAADAILMCSPNEAMGQVTAEAMSMCRPVIGLGRAGTAELIHHGRTGLLYQGGAGALAACMQQFLERPQWARRLGIQAWHAARRRYTTERYARGVYKVLQEVSR